MSKIGFKLEFSSTTILPKKVEVEKKEKNKW
jgi:hypothetical protein